MFSWVRDCNAFYVDSDSDQEESLSDSTIFISHDTVEYEGIVLDEENFRLTEAELSQYAKLSSKLRADFEKRAQDVDQ